jgi:acetate kinase
VQQVLIVNAGSTSLKLHLVHADKKVESIDALESVRGDDLCAIGHRVVYGGRKLVEPALIDDALRESIEDAAQVAPLHNAAALRAIDAAREVFPGHAHVAVFDSAFHADMPAEASTYAIPQSWRDDWGIRRYGFHGLSVEWCAERVAELVDEEAADLRLVVCHLGGGSSVTAVRGGRSVDTTMGFSPLEGVPMATRSGSLDPGALLYVQRVRGLSLDDVERVLNAESGLWALSGGREIPEVVLAAPDDETAELALKVYAYRVATAVASMGAALGGLDALAFTAGVGEHSPTIRAAVCARLEFLGVQLDRRLNERITSDGEIGKAGSAARAFVISSREELVAARAVRAFLADGERAAGAST